MPQPSPSSISPTTTTMGLLPGQSLWLYLPPGGFLRATQGEVCVRFTPDNCGHALHTPTHARLKAGDYLPRDVKQAQAAWVLVDNALHCRAEIQVTEGTPAPRLRHVAARWMRALAGRLGKKGRTYGGALHATR